MQKPQSQDGEHFCGNHLGHDRRLVGDSHSRAHLEGQDKEDRVRRLDQEDRGRAEVLGRYCNPEGNCVEDRRSGSWLTGSDAG